MFVVTAICPNCKKTHKYFLGHGKAFRVRDIVGEKYETFINNFTESCPSCGEILTFIVSVFKGELVSININPSQDYIKDVSEAPYETCYFTDSMHNYDQRQILLLGADTEVIPYQYFLDSKFKIGDEITLFNYPWKIKESYRVVTESGCVVRLVFKVRYSSVEKLLVLRDCYFPELKELIWSNDDFINEEDKFRRFKIPDGCELVMNLN